MPAPDLRIEALTRSFGSTVALDGVSLEVQPGEILGILGPSGCGKSTLLQLVAGHLEPDSGTVEIAGQRVAGDGAWVPPQRRGVGMVFQDYALFPHLTVAENVGFALGTTRRLLRRGRGASGRVGELLDLFGIGELARRYPHELSGGQQQRVAIARALAHAPALLMLDEPFCNLDGATREHVRGEIVARLRETGLSCLFVTHDQEEALAVSDRVAVMTAGRVVQVDEPEALYRRPFCAEVAEFFGRANVLEGTASGRMAFTVLGTFVLPTPAQGPVHVLVRPEQLEVVPDPNGQAVVASREFRGHDVVYQLRLDSGTILWSHRPSLRMASVGDRVRIETQSHEATTLEQGPGASGAAAGATAAGDSTAAVAGTELVGDASLLLN
jgi:iron(III) transport system ATP-binding protein